MDEECPKDSPWYYFQSFERFHEYYAREVKETLYYKPLHEFVASYYMRDWNTLWIGFQLKRDLWWNGFPTWNAICEAINKKEELPLPRKGI
jgi:hypothetical protein